MKRAGNCQLEKCKFYENKNCSLQIEYSLLLLFINVMYIYVDGNKFKIYANTIQGRVRLP